MPKRFFILSALTAAFLVAACTETGPDEPVVTPNNSNGGGCLDTLYTSLEQPSDTRLTLSGNDTDGYHLNWEEDDAVKVLCDGCSEASTFTLCSGADTDAGFFSGELPNGKSPYYAVFATSDANPSISNGLLTFSVPMNKGAMKNNITKTGIPAVATVGNDNSVALRNVFGLLRVTFTSDQPVYIKKIALHDLAGNMLWGRCSVPVKDDGQLDYENASISGGSNTVTMTWNTAPEINSTPKSYYFPIPAGALDGGFSIVLYEKDESRANGVGRAYSFLQKISGTQPMPRSGILAVNAAVTAKPEAYDAKGRGYYKSLFVNAGMYLSNYYKATSSSDDAIFAISAMGLEEDYEYFASNVTADLGDAGKYESNQTAQNNVMVGSESDRNGVLLYPDGAPRFRMVYVNGGRSRDHGPSLTQTGRDRFHTFFTNGGSYVGSCAGSFLSCKYVDGENHYDSANPDDNFTFGIFPGSLYHTNLPINISDYPTIYTDQSIMQSMTQLLNNDYPGEFPALTGCLADIKHHGGSYLYQTSASNNEMKDEGSLVELMKYEYATGSGEYYYNETNSDKVYFKKNGSFIDRTGKVSTWTYKPLSGTAGRAVCAGSHPEHYNSEREIQYTQFMFRYAMDGNGPAIVKTPDLQLGNLRRMKETPANYDSPASANAGIGDRQYHHFKFEVPSGGYDNFVLKLDSGYNKDSGIDLYLALRNGGLAWLSDADYTLCNKGGQKALRIKHLPAGTWYVSVYCATTVKASFTTSLPKYAEYSGNTEVLNGIPYSIKISTLSESPYNGAEIIPDYNAAVLADDFDLE